MLVGKRIRLRAIELEDLPLLQKWRNDPQVYQYFYEHEPLSLVMQRKWFESFLQRNDEKLWIIETISGEAIGTIGLVHLDWRNRKAELGRILIYPEEHRHGGYGSEAESLLLTYAFDHLNLNRLCAEVFADNEKGIHVHRRFGFKQEGVFRQYVFKNGAFRDVVYLALLREEYLTESKPTIQKLLGE
jgi:UDP-4-amino-4,6-dideoxy-N-acetyl-beta-L-altrosamine N-acetyltransferase